MRSPAVRENREGPLEHAISRKGRNWRSMRGRVQTSEVTMEPSEYGLMDKAEDRMWWYCALHARLIGSLIGVNGVVLDAGCGTGGFLTKLRQARPDLSCVGVEWSA